MEWHAGLELQRLARRTVTITVTNEGCRLKFCPDSKSEISASRETLLKKITVFLKTEIKCMYENLEGRRQEKEAFCILRSSYKFMLRREGQTRVESLLFPVVGK